MATMRLPQLSICYSVARSSSAWSSTGPVSAGRWYPSERRCGSRLTQTEIEKRNVQHRQDDCLPADPLLRAARLHEKRESNDNFEGKQERKIQHRPYVTASHQLFNDA